MVDGTIVGSLEKPAKLEVKPFDSLGGVMGADLNGNNGARFDLFEIVVYVATLTTSETEKLKEKYFKDRTVTSYVQFSGTQWLRQTEAKKSE
jgi:hypothetical protein